MIDTPDPCRTGLIDQVDPKLAVSNLHISDSSWVGSQVLGFMYIAANIWHKSTDILMQWSSHDYDMCKLWIFFKKEWKQIKCMKTYKLNKNTNIHGIMW